MSENNDEISLKELIFKVRHWVHFLLSKWMIIILWGIISGIIGLTYAITKKPTYTGTLTFVLSNNSSTSGGGLASLAGQFGLDIGSSGSNGAFEGENIIELLKSRRIIKGALFKRVPEESDLLINIVGKEHGFFTLWKKNQRTSNQIPFPDNFNKISLIQDSLTNIIYTALITKSLAVEKKDKKLSFYQVKATSTKANISISLTKNIVEEAAKMYIDTKTKTARENLMMLQYEADSLRSRLGGTIYSSVTQMDQTFNLNPALQIKRAPMQQNQIQTQVLGVAYGEVVKNLEIAKIALQKETPLYQVIDEPRSLVEEKLGRLKTFVISFLLGIIICILFLGVKKIVAKIL